MDNIIEFINRRFGNAEVQKSFLCGNCYWFAYILTARFQNLEIYYDAVQGHFVAGCSGCYYDVTGPYYPQNELIRLEEIKETDPNWYQRLLRDCIK